jgi:O-antigen/teichoic acid export membrane protein
MWGHISSLWVRATREIQEFLSLRVSRTRALRANFLWNAVGSGVFAFGQWTVLVVFAKLGTPSLVGQLVYGLAITTPVFVVASLQLRSIQATDATNRYAVGQYFGLRVLTTGAALMVSLIIAGAMYAVGNKLALIVLMWAASKTVDSGSDSLYGFFQRCERMDYVGASLILRGVVGTTSVALLFYVSRSTSLALLGLVVGWLSIFLLFDLPMTHTLLRYRLGSHGALTGVPEWLGIVLNPRKVLRLCVEAVPLGIVAFLLAVQAQLPRYVVIGVFHTRELGLFSAAAYLTLIGSMLINSLGAPACVRLAKYYTAGTYLEFRRLMAKLLIVAATLGLGGIALSACAGGRILALLYTREYAGMAGVLTLLCVANALSYVASFLGYAMTAVRRYKIQVPLFVVVIAITFVASYWLTELYGLMGTAIGIMIGNLAQLLMSAVVVWRSTRGQYQHALSSRAAIVTKAEPAL